MGNKNKAGLAGNRSTAGGWSSTQKANTHSQPQLRKRTCNVGNKNKAGLAGNRSTAGGWSSTQKANTVTGHL